MKKMSFLLMLLLSINLSICGCGLSEDEPDDDLVKGHGAFCYEEFTCKYCGEEGVLIEYRDPRKPIKNTIEKMSIDCQKSNKNGWHVGKQRRVEYWSVGGEWKKIHDEYIDHAYRNPKSKKNPSDDPSSFFN